MHTSTICRESITQPDAKNKDKGDLLLWQFARFSYIVTPPSLGKIKLILSIYMQHWIRGWVDPGASPDAEEKRNFFSSENRTPIHRSSSLQINQYTDRVMPSFPGSLHAESEWIVKYCSEGWPNLKREGEKSQHGRIWRERGKSHSKQKIQLFQ